MRSLIAEGIITEKDHNISPENPWSDIYMRLDNKMVDQAQAIGVQYDESNGGKPHLEFMFPQGIIGIMKEEELDLHPSQHIRDLAARPILYLITSTDRDMDRVYMSRKKARAILAKKTWESLQVGQRKKAVVVAIAKNGFILDIGGVNAYMHRSEVGWGPLRKPLNQLFKPGDQLEVEVIKFRRPGEVEVVEKEKISKVFYMNPPADDSEAGKPEPGESKTESAGNEEEEYEETTEPTAEATAEENTAGAASTAELAAPASATAEVEQKETKMKELAGRIWVSRKATMTDPWLDPSFLYKMGGEYRGTVRKIGEQGVFVELKEGVEVKVRHARKNPPVGSTVLVRIKHIEFEKRRMKGQFVRILN